jgi:hydroxymethylglutaryl-CoA reductase (NADPH)
MLDLDVTKGGDLYASAHMRASSSAPSAGGSAQGTARECLELLGCLGAGKPTCSPRSSPPPVLAGDLSLLASFATHEFTPRTGARSKSAGT